MTKETFCGFCSENSENSLRSESFQHKNQRRKFFDNPVDIKLDRFFSPEQAAEYLNVSRKFIYERIQRGELAAQRVGRLKRIRQSTIEAWLNRQEEWRRP